MGLDAAATVMMCVCVVSVLAADGERQRIGHVRAMRRCLLRMHDVLRYEQLPLVQLLRCMDMKATKQERALTGILHECANGLEKSPETRLGQLFAAACAKSGWLALLSGEDREAFEWILAELGRCGLAEQLRLISEADERLRQREEMLCRECGQRARLIRTLGFSGGAALFLILV